jgi:hypothetical protein
MLRISVFPFSVGLAVSDRREPSAAFVGQTAPASPLRSYRELGCPVQAARVILWLVARYESLLCSALSSSFPHWDAHPVGMGTPRDKVL